MTPDIESELDAIIGVWADSQKIPIALDNIEFKPPDEGFYLTVHNMPATTYSVDLAGQSKVLPGIYQINVVALAGTGKKKAKALASKIASVFPEGRELSGSDFTGWVMSEPSIYAGITTRTNYTIPISINYRAHFNSN